MKSILAVFLLLVLTAAAGLTAARNTVGQDRPPSGSNVPAPASAAAPTASITVPVPPLAAQDDPALLRLELLHRLDAHLDSLATQSRLEMRRILDEVLPIPYFGVDSEMTLAGLKLLAVYADTGAERAGMQKGDVLHRLAGVAIDSKLTFARTIRSHRVGEVLEAQFERAGKPMTLNVTLAPRAEEDEDEEEQFPDLARPAAALPAPLMLDFDAESLASTPQRLESLLGGHGRLGAWKVIALEKGRALRQDDDDKTGVRFPMVIARDFDARDAKVTVRFRYASGRVDRAGGIVLRYLDPGNYLVARANAAEADLRIFRVTNGDRRTLPGAIAKGATDDDRWHTLEFTCEGTQLTAVLDGTVRATAQDSYLLHGRVGLWTKSDSRTEFDDLTLTAMK